MLLFLERETGIPPMRKSADENSASRNLKRKTPSSRKLRPSSPQAGNKVPVYQGPQLRVFRYEDVQCFVR
jgi:hypothetical protein